MKKRTDQIKGKFKKIKTKHGIWKYKYHGNWNSKYVTIESIKRIK